MNETLLNKSGTYAEMPTQKYVIVKFLKPIADGTEFNAKHWPLQWFTVLYGDKLGT